MKQKSNKSRALTTGLLQDSLFSRAPWGNAKSLPTTARLLQTTFTMGFSCVSSQKSQQGQVVGSESLLNYCICSTHVYHNWKLALANSDHSRSPPATGYPTLLFLLETTGAPSPISAASLKMGETWSAEDPLLETSFFPFSLPSSPVFQAETSLLFPELFIKGSEVFLWITLMFQGAILLLCKIPFSVLLKLIQSGITYFVKNIVQKY